MKGYPLVQDTDVYDTSRLTEEQIAAEPWSEYCKIYEDSDMNITFIPYENI